MSKEIFRKAALERLSSPEKLDELIQLTTARTWLSVVVLGVLVVTTILWGFYGSIPIKILGMGILLQSGGIDNIVAAEAGQIEEIYVSVGDVVEKGQVVASFLQPIGVESSEENFSLVGRFRSEQQKQSRSSLQLSSDIRSLAAGRVIEIAVDKGKLVNRGETLIILEPVGNQKVQAILYINPGEGKKALPGMRVQVSPSTINREEFGFIYGSVKSVSEFPATAEAMTKVMKNQQLVQSFTREGAPSEIIVELQVSEHTPSGYLWSSRKGPETGIYSGTLCSASIVIREQKPIVFVLTWIKEFINE